MTDKSGNGKNSQHQQCLKNSLYIDEKVKHRSHRLTIAHRGASYSLPEHTLAAYRLALELGADFVEPDLVLSRDFELIALHSVDLEQTTDVATVFADRPRWFSPFANKTGYWAFNFTFAELSQLKTKQRLPETRTKAFDGIFGIPRIEEIVHLVNHWNHETLPQLLPPVDNSTAAVGNSQRRRPTSVEAAYAGIYLELKEAEWHRSDMGVSLVDVFFQKLEKEQQAWQKLMPCFQELRFDEYKVPGLVIQSFDPTVLQDFHARWINTTDPTVMAEPPYVLLIDEPECREDQYWFRVVDGLRSQLSGIGCPVSCLLPEEEQQESASTAHKNYVTQPTLTQLKAEEFRLVLHAWTERPEFRYRETFHPTVEEEIHFLYCHAGAQGVFSESVSAAVTASVRECTSNEEDKHHGGAKSHGLTGGNSTSAFQVCYSSELNEKLFVGFTAFAIGFMVSSLCLLGVTRRRRRLQSTPVPTSDPSVEMV